MAPIGKRCEHETWSLDTRRDGTGPRRRHSGQAENGVTVNGRIVGRGSGVRVIETGEKWIAPRTNRTMGGASADLRSDPM